MSGLEGRVARCLRCGARTLAGVAERPWVFTCVRCGVPFPSGQLLGHDAQECPACSQGRPAASLEDAELVQATEAEIREALADRWRMVGEPRLSGYLDGLAAGLAHHVDDAALRPRVVLVDEASFRTLALPSGTLLISLGVLDSLDNEAELAFVLAHELAHARSSDAAMRLVRLGFDSVSRADGSAERPAWAAAVEDLVRVGYGRRRERDADGRAVEAMLRVGYDPAAGPALLRRLERRMRDGDERLAELATSHPPPEDRARRIERQLHARLRGGEPLRLNREVFRRVVGPAGPGRGLEPVPLDVKPDPADAARSGLPRWVPAAAGVALIAAVILLIAFLLTR